MVVITFSDYILRPLDTQGIFNLNWHSRSLSNFWGSGQETSSLTRPTLKVRFNIS